MPTRKQQRRDKPNPTYRRDRTRSKQLLAILRATAVPDSSLVLHIAWRLTHPAPSYLYVGRFRLNQAQPTSLRGTSIHPRVPPCSPCSAPAPACGGCHHRTPGGSRCGTGNCRRPLPAPRAGRGCPKHAGSARTCQGTPVRGRPMSKKKNSGNLTRSPRIGSITRFPYHCFF